jgi:hypothetical protein
MLAIVKYAIKCDKGINKPNAWAALLNLEKPPYLAKSVTFTEPLNLSLS